MDEPIDPAEVAAQAEVVAAVSRTAERAETPCGVGAMVWRIWGEGPTVVLLHGGSGSWSHWLRAIPLLARDYRLLVPDLPGAGDSAALPEPRTVTHLAEIVSDGLDALLGRAEPVFLVGFSFGSLVGGFMLDREAARVRRLVMVGAASLGPLDPVRDKLRRWRGETDPQARLAAHRHNLAALMLAEPAAIDALSLHLQAVNAEGRGLGTKNLPGQTNLLARLEGTRTPLAGIWGEKDALSARYLDAREHHLRRLDPQAPFHIVRGAGHWVQHEATEEVVRVLRDIFAHDLAAAG